MHFRASGLGKPQQIIDQPGHLANRLGDLIQIAFWFTRQGFREAPGQQVHITGDMPERRAQVVRNGITEGFQFLVGEFKLLVDGFQLDGGFLCDEASEMFRIGLSAFGDIFKDCGKVPILGRINGDGQPLVQGCDKTFQVLGLAGGCHPSIDLEQLRIRFPQARKDFGNLLAHDIAQAG